MSEEAIKKLRRKFIFYAMLTLSVVMCLIAGLIYIINLVVTRNEIRETMNYIVQRDGIIQDADYLYVADPAGTPGNAETSAGGSGEKSEEAGTAGEGRTEIAPQSSSQTEHILKGLNQTIDENTYDIVHFLNEVFGTSQEDDLHDDSEDAFSTRYFAVIYGNDGLVQAIIANHISSLTGDEAEALGNYAKGRLFHFGQYGKYYYQVADYGTGGTIVVYLDSTNQIHATTRLLYSAMLLIIFGVLVTFVFVRLFSTKAIAPEIRNAELQKQFITNASHELKTPLAVIRANTEMQEILTGENEWTQSTLRQVDRLNGLIQNLVTITKAQESETEERVPTDVSKIVNDVVETYVPVSQQDEKTMVRNIPEGITMRAVDSEIRQLATLLLDNAIKYCDEKGTIETGVWQKGKETWIAVSNDYAEGKDVDYSRFFERFYRKDEAHTIDSSGKDNKGGYGIGLSIAESLVKKYNGSIRADWKEGKITFTCMLR